MAHYAAPVDWSVDTSGSLVLPADPFRVYLGIQNRDTSNNIKIFVLPKGSVAPASTSALFYTVAPGQLWERRGNDCPANAIFVASATGTIAVIVEDADLRE